MISKFNQQTIREFTIRISQRAYLWRRVDKNIVSFYYFEMRFFRMQLMVI